MKNKKLLVIILLSLSFCFVSRVGYGEVKQLEYDYQAKTSYMDSILYMRFVLLEARLNYMMSNSPDFLYVSFHYDPDGVIGKTGGFPERVDTEGKVFITVIDTKDEFSDKSGVVLRKQFEMILEPIYLFIQGVATDMDNDVVAVFADKEGTRLGCFYQGEYHLWEEQKQNKSQLRLREKGEKILNQEKRLQISKDVFIDVGSFGMRVNEAWCEGRITEAEFYSAIGLYRVESALDVLINRLTSLPDHLT